MGRTDARPRGACSSEHNDVKVQWPWYGVWTEARANALLDAITDASDEDGSSLHTAALLERLANRAAKFNWHNVAPLARFYLAGALFHLGHMDRALGALELSAHEFTRAGRHEDAATAFETLHDWADRLGASALAVEAADGLIAAQRAHGDPVRIAEALARRAQQALLDGEADRALMFAAEGSALAPDTHDCHLVAGRAHADLGAHDHAAGAAQRALDTAPDAAGEVRAALLWADQLDPWSMDDGAERDETFAQLERLLERASHAAQRSEDDVLQAEAEFAQVVHLSGGPEASTRMLELGADLAVKTHEIIVLMRAISASVLVAASVPVADSRDVLSAVFATVADVLEQALLDAPHLTRAFALVHHAIYELGQLPSRRDALGPLVQGLQVRLGRAQTPDTDPIAGRTIDLMNAWLETVADVASAGFFIAIPAAREALEEAEGLVESGLPQECADLLLTLVSTGADVA